MNDAPRLFSACESGDAFLNGIGWTRLEGMDDALARIARQCVSFASGAWFAWCVRSVERSSPTVVPDTSQRMLGQVTLKREPEPDTWILSYWIHPDSQRRGYAREAARVVVDWAFEELGAASLWGGAAETNGPSLRVLEALGLVLKERNPEGYRLNGMWVETLEHELTREEWVVSRLRKVK